MADIGLSAFSLFFMRSESFLSHQKRRLEGYGISNCQTLFGMEKIPTYNHIRTMSAYLVFPSWHSLMNTLISCNPPPT